MARINLSILSKEERIQLIIQQFLSDEVMKKHFKYVDKEGADIEFEEIPHEKTYTHYQLRSLASGQICVLLLGQNYMLRRIPTKEATENTFNFNFINKERKLDLVTIHFTYL